MRLLAAALLALVVLASLAPSAAAEPVPVKVGVLVINFGNYDTNKGTYVMDFYLWMRWTPADAPDGFSPEKFELMNGRATAKDRIFDETDAATGEREVWYRIQASLYSEPRLENYPYDSQTLELVFEDSEHDASALVYEILADESGLDEDVRVSGWRVSGVDTRVAEKTYKFGDTHSRVEMELTLSRETLSTSLKTLLPPMAFMLISGLSFFLHPTKIAQRLALGTSMIISAVMFHISQTVNLPPLGKLILFDKIMLCVYAFLAGSLVVTTLIAIDEDYWKGVDHTRKINAWGSAATVLLPLAVFAALALW